MNQNPQQDKKPQGKRNPGASLQNRLRNYARSTGEDVSIVLVRYLNERFLYRLSVSQFRDRFILRGAHLFTIWNAEPHRSTRDIDFMATGDNSSAEIRTIIEAVCAQTVGEEDGVVFLIETLNIEERTEGRAYQGSHVEVIAALGSARLRLEIDIAVGEAIVPPAEEVDLPTLLEKPIPRLRAYRMETVIAEKSQALVKLGMVNTRMKDFYDLWYLCSAYSFEGTELCAALDATFVRRGTSFPINGTPLALTELFYNDAQKQKQWRAFVNKVSLKKEPGELSTVVLQISRFLQLPFQALEIGRSFDLFWSPEFGWNDKT